MSFVRLGKKLIKSLKFLHQNLHQFQGLIGQGHFRQYVFASNSELELVSNVLFLGLGLPWVPKVKRAKSIRKKILRLFVPFLWDQILKKDR